MRLGLHVLELVHPALGIALADLPEGFVLVAALAHVLAVDSVHGGLLGLVPGVGQVLFEGLRLKGGEHK